MTTWDPPLTKGELQARANYALSLERQGVPLEEAIRKGDELIAGYRAFGHETPFQEHLIEAFYPLPDPRDNLGNW